MAESNSFEELLDRIVVRMGRVFQLGLQIFVFEVDIGNSWRILLVLRFVDAILVLTD